MFDEENKVIARALKLKALAKNKIIDALMCIESAERCFGLRYDEWLNADDENFLHDFYGIVGECKRGPFPASDFGGFVPRFSKN